MTGKWWHVVNILGIAGLTCGLLGGPAVLRRLLHDLPHQVDGLVGPSLPQSHY